jgi:predicted DCC family thiol-disulfide oxidoreductase YuxK
MKNTESSRIVLFDGVCNLCNGTINFLIDKDKHNKLSFASLQSDFAKKKLQEFNVSTQYLESVIFIRKKNIYFKSRAILEICRELGGVWALLYGFVIFPAFLRDLFYNWVAKNRYKWFGKQDTCRMPTPELKMKFLG